MHVLFVCTGNICRSPTAERLARVRAERMGLSDIVFSSAGVAALVGRPMHAEGARALQALGGDPSDFTARRITPKIAATADLILTMTTAHRDAVIELAPRRHRRTFGLAEAAELASLDDALTLDDLADLRPRLAEDPPDILDPMGRTADVYAAVAARIDGYLPAVLGLLQPAAD